MTQWLETMKMHKRGTARIIAAIAGLIFCALCSGQATKPNDAFKDVTPAKAPLKTELFNLVDETGDFYNTPDGKNVRQAFDSLINSTGSKTGQMKERLLSGPEPEGALWQAGTTQKWLYSACQQHVCSTTNAVLLYNQESKQMVGRLMVRCNVTWLGDPTDTDKALIDTTSPVDSNDPNRKFDCAKG
jgi:hypothetical protein